MIRMFLDEGVHLGVAEALRSLGFEAWHVLEVGLAGATDHALLAEAVRRDAALVSHDSDFHRILASTRATSPTVIRLRVEVTDPHLLARLIADAVAGLAELAAAGAAISVDLSIARGRRLPLT